MGLITSPNLSRSSTINIALGGFITGTLDAVAAIVVYKADPVKMFQYIASAAVDPAKINGTLTMTLLGIFFHYLIALVWCALLYSVFQALHKWLKHWITVGVVWGIVVWCGMNFIVLPMSRLPARAFDAGAAAISASIIIAAVGVPAAFVISRRLRV